MPEELPKPKMSYIPARVKQFKNVAIYCRVSTMHKAQEDSLENQIAGLKHYVADNPNWQLYRVYTDQDSGGNTYRQGFQDMIFDCYENKIDIVLVKSISRFARNTVDLLETIKRLKGLRIEVIFHQEDLRTSETENDVLISTLGAIAQAESESTGEAIKWGLKQGFLSGKSKLYSRKCYGYKHDQDGELIIDDEPAKVVRLIYDLYLSGLSVLLISRELAKKQIKSPQGKDSWSIRAIQTVLNNEKYTGRVILGKTFTDEFPKNKQRINRGQQERYLAEDAHVPIIDIQTFEKVQEEMRRRSNVGIVDGRFMRKKSHYSSRKGS
jgi:site-specific DNA recombinase